MSANRIRFAVTIILLMVTGALLELRGARERIPQAQPLKAFPSVTGRWRSVDLPLDPEVLEVLGPGDFLNRVYRPDGDRIPVHLFIGYFPSQRVGDTIHSPQHCLPGAGWGFETIQRVPLQLPGLSALQVNEAVIAKGAEKQFVLYWYQAHGRGVASEYWAKFYLAADAIRMNRTDGALVRFITPMLPGETMRDASRRAIELASRLSPRLNEFIPE